MSDSTEECTKVGREYKQLIQLFSDQTIFGFALLEQANNLTIDESDAEMSKCACVLLLLDSYQMVEAFDVADSVLSGMAEVHHKSRRVGGNLRFFSCDLSGKLTKPNFDSISILALIFSQILLALAAVTCIYIDKL